MICPPLAALQVLLKAWGDAGGYDGILGFSNGAAAAFLLTAFLAQGRNHTYSGKIGDNRMHLLPPPPTFVLLAGGYLPEPLSCLVPEELVESDGEMVGK